MYSRKLRELRAHFLILSMMIFVGLECRVSASVPLPPSHVRIIDFFEQLGIDTPSPRFGWVGNAALGDRGERQTAYEIIVSAKEAEIRANRGTLWDSGKVASAQQYGISYGGPALTKTTKYWWKVRAWDNDSQPSPWSDEASFITGFFQLSDWNPSGQWIAAPESVTTKAGPRPMFRKTFQADKPVRNAYLYVTGLGQFVASLNGTKVGNHEIDPAWTDYDRTVDYVTFDVTSQVKTGGNALGVMLGSGWLGSHDSAGIRNFGPLRLRAQLHLEYSDGTSQEVVSDASWKVAQSPFTSTELHGAEDYDARMEQPGWNTDSFDDSSWANASIANSPAGALIAQSSPPVIARQTFAPVKVTNPAPHVYIYDMGQNFDGQYEITVTGNAGSKIKILPGEFLNKDGTVNPGRSAGSNYILKGKATETWRLTFSTIGFRYIQLSDVSQDLIDPDLPSVQKVTGYFTYTASEDVGSFACSDDRDNQIYDLALKTLQSNFTSLHTDGPNYEKLGWQEVAWLAPLSATYKYDLQTLLVKIARDIRDAQRTVGLCPNIAPNWFYNKDHPPGNVYDDSPAWGASMFMVPWQTYLAYGDLKVLQDNYESMKNYLAYLKGKESNGVLSYGLGDWMAPAGTNVPNVEGAIYVLDTRVMRDAAQALGNNQDADLYGQEYARVRAAYNSAYFDEGSSSYKPMTQANQAMPLALGIVPDAEEQSAVKALVADIATPAAPQRRTKFGPAQANHITAGDVGTLFVWQALGDNGHSDLVQTMITQPDVPSYQNMINSGETTITENWDTKRTRSHNHDMYAGIFDWFYRSLAGISQTKPGYEEFQIKPDLTTDITHVHCTYNSVRGLIGSDWERQGGQLKLKVIVPVNSTATVYIPAHDADSVLEGNLPAKQAAGIQFVHMEASTAVFSVGSGEYTFQSRLP